MTVHAPARYLLLGILLLAVASFFSETLRSAYEIVSLSLFPDAERAHALGERHFSSKDPGAYNIDLADYFFRRALELDPTLPFVYRERARIAFLRGDYAAALHAIDLQIDKHGEAAPNAYYIRALIKGFMGDYTGAKADYERYLVQDPYSWAAINDYTWVLLKSGAHAQALVVTEAGLRFFPDNAWLLNSAAIASFESGEREAALAYALRARDAAAKLRDEDWLIAYPGNDPKIASDGMRALRESIDANIHSIRNATTSPAVE